MGMRQQLPDSGWCKGAFNIAGFAVDAWGPNLSDAVINTVEASQLEVGQVRRSFKNTLQSSAID